MNTVRAIRNAGLVLIALQAGVVAIFVHQIITDLSRPYVSEWLTADAFVPYYILFALFYGLCMFLTWWVMRDHRLWIKWSLIPLAVITALPYVALIHDALRAGAT